MKYQRAPTLPVPSAAEIITSHVASAKSTKAAQVQGREQYLFRHTRSIAAQLMQALQRKKFGMQTEQGIDVLKLVMYHSMQRPPDTGGIYGDKPSLECHAFIADIKASFQKELHACGLNDGIPMELDVPYARA